MEYNFIIYIFFILAILYFIYFNSLNKILKLINIICIDIVFILSIVYIYTLFTNQDFLLSFFISISTTLLYFFIRTKLPGHAWELMLRNKYSKNLDTFMIILSLIFTVAFSFIISFEIKSSFFTNDFIIIGIFLLYIIMNIILLSILTVIYIYILNTLETSNKVFMSIILIIMGVSLFILELVKFDYAHNNYLVTKKGDNIEYTKNK